LQPARRTWYTRRSNRTAKRKHHVVGWPDSAGRCTLSRSIVDRINELKSKLNAVILAHNYQPPPIQDLADFTGDSLGLSIEASRTSADVIVFCGVRFMAETAAVLSPDKMVLLPDEHADCPMANMITADDLRHFKSKHPNALVVCYVNSTAAVKAESDYCCTSANAVEVVDSLPRDREVIFVPDRHLGRFVQQRTHRELLLWPGYCASHVVITEDDIRRARAAHPDAVVMAHPECTEPVKDLADQVLSTSQMLRFVESSDARCFIVATECGMIYPLRKRNPRSQFIPASDRAVCPNMKRITLEKVLWSLEDLKYRVSIPTGISRRARAALDRMVEVLPTK